MFAGSNELEAFKPFMRLQRRFTLAQRDYGDC